jgi:6-phospho-3-hexuloisomerase
VPKKFAGRVHRILDELKEILVRVDPTAVDQLAQELMQANRIFLFGQGRTGFMTRAFASRLMHLGIQSHFVGETTVPAIAAGDLCLVNSGTGKTRFVYHVAAVAKEAGARLATITAHPEARIGRMADVVVAVPAPTKGESVGPSGSTQPPGSLFEQAALLLMDAVVMAIMERLDISAATLAARHANIE